jgi:hypothetical protein
VSAAQSASVTQPHVAVDVMHTGVAGIAAHTLSLREEHTVH